MDPRKIKEEYIAGFELGFNNVSTQCDFPEIHNEHTFMDKKTSLMLETSRKSFKSEHNVADGFKSQIGDTSNTHTVVLDTNNKEYKCDICKISFQLKHVLINHMKSIHATVNSIKKPYKCLVCYKKFAYYLNLYKHAKSHISQKSTVLKHTRKKSHIGQKTFSSDSLLSRHAMMMQTEEMLYACDICPKVYKQKSCLSRHVMTKHTGEIMYACDFCQQTFYHKSSLTDHKKLHSRKKSYVCDVCLKTFNRKSHLLRHALIHTRKNPFMCDVCQEPFYYKRSLADHRKSHYSE